MLLLVYLGILLIIAVPANLFSSWELESMNFITMIFDEVKAVFRQLLYFYY